MNKSMTVTGRFQSKEPNIMEVSRSSGLFKVQRKLDLDYATVEKKVLAPYSAHVGLRGVPKFSACFDSSWGAL